jgi:hypothetical protein
MDPLLPLERFAALSAEIETGVPPDAILAREGLSPEQWAAFEAMWRARIEEDIAQGSFELTNRYNAAFVARRAALRYETPEGAAAARYADPMQPVPTPRMLQEPPAMVADPMQPPRTPRMVPEPPAMVADPMPPPPTPRMLQAPPPAPAMVAPVDPSMQPPPTPRMLQAPPPVPAMVADPSMQPPPTPRMRQGPPPLPRAAQPRPAFDIDDVEDVEAIEAVEDSPTPVPETLRPGMVPPVTAGDRPTPPPSTQEDRATGPDELSPPSSRPADTPRQEAQEGPRFDALPFRPAPPGSDVAPRSTGDLSGVLPFKPAAVSTASPMAAAPAPASPAPAGPDEPWVGTGTVKMSVIAGPSPPPAELEPEIAAPMSARPAAPFTMPVVSGPPVLTGPGALVPAPIVFPFALWRRVAEPPAHPAYAPPAYSPQAQTYPAQPPAHPAQPQAHAAQPQIHAAHALPPHALPAHALPPHSVPAHALPAHLPQAPQAAPPQGHAPQARPSQPGFPAVAPPASPQALPLTPPQITSAPVSTHLAPVSSRQTLPPNLVAASPVVPFKAAVEGPTPFSVATAAGFPPPIPYTPLSVPAAPAPAPAPAPAAPAAFPPQAAAAPPPQQPGLAVPAVLGASSSRLTLEQYASLSAEVAISPGTSAAVRARYGLDENAYVAETGLWQRRFSADKELFTRYSALYQSYREWFSRSAR